MSRFGYTIVHVPDVRAAVEFYEKAFGLERRFVDEAGQRGDGDGIDGPRLRLRGIDRR